MLQTCVSFESTMGLWIENPGAKAIQGIDNEPNTTAITLLQKKRPNRGGLSQRNARTILARRNPSGCRDKDSFGFEEFFKTKVTPFPAITGLLIATKGRCKIRATAIDMDVPATNAGGNRNGVINIT